MAIWKKVIVSGSSAELAALHVDGLSSGVVTGASGNLTTTPINGSGNIVGTTGATGLSVSGSFSGSFFGAFTGNLAGNASTATSASQAANAVSSSYALVAPYSGLTGIPAGIVSGSSQLNNTSISGLTLTNVIATGSFSGDGSNLTGIASTLSVSGSSGNGIVSLKTQALSIVGTTNEVETSVSGQTVTVGLPNNVTVTSNLNVGGNAVVTGDLTVNGTTTTLNTNNLLIEDKFALFASGSIAGTDGGIVIQSAVNGSGYAFGYKTSVDRWVLEDSLSGTATAFSSTPTAYVASAQYGLASAKPSDATGPSYGGNTAGFGNIWVSTDTSDIWIYA